MVYNRWTPQELKSWPYRCLKYYYDEINRLLMAHKSALLYSCKQLASQLKKDGGNDDSKASTYLHTGKGNNKLTIRQWHKSYTDFDNWTNLNAIVALTSAFETYLNAIVKLALDSDPGVIINASRSIDGIKQKKYNIGYNPERIGATVTACTKGDWTARTNAMKNLFENIPTVFTDNIALLEEIRTLRNDVAHAFGRNIDAAKDYRRFDIAPMKKVTHEKFRTYQSIVLRCARQLDEQLLPSHIGLYPLLLFYHENHQQLTKHPIETRFDFFKTLIGKESQKAISKDLAKWVVEYYEDL